ncbi:Conserved oligomeric Golgi complex subunit 4 [Platanthera zijinensis]|uniref:Conserved oligomeric Golgi complex subunit 4 n=1 Tax=Platanthera zijinensis TaxID=2320716 RepID=A0AAP0BQR6_9ASPA
MPLSMTPDLTTAVDKRDHLTILCFVRVFPLLGLQEEGLQIYVSYLRKVIAIRSRLEFEHLTEIANQDSQISLNLGQGGWMDEATKPSVLLNLEFTVLVMSISLMLLPLRDSSNFFAWDSSLFSEAISSYSILTP